MCQKRNLLVRCRALVALPLLCALAFHPLASIECVDEGCVCLRLSLFRPCGWLGGLSEWSLRLGLLLHALSDTWVHVADRICLALLLVLNFLRDLLHFV